MSKIVVLRAGVSGCIAWRMVDMLAIGACIVLDRSPFPEWPVSLKENENFLSLGLGITTDCQPAPEEDYAGIVSKMDAFLQDDAYLDSIRRNNIRYFDDFLSPIQSVKTLIGVAAQFR